MNAINAIKAAADAAKPWIWSIYNAFAFQGLKDKDGFYSVDLNERTTLRDLEVGEVIILKGQYRVATKNDGTTVETEAATPTQIARFRFRQRGQYSKATTIVNGVPGGIFDEMKQRSERKKRLWTAGDAQSDGINPVIEQFFAPGPCPKSGSTVKERAAKQQKNNPAVLRPAFVRPRATK